MKQQDLFSKTRKQKVRITSIMSYHEIKENLSPKRREIFEWLVEHDKPATANEIFRGMFGSTHIAQTNISARLNEMRELGAVLEGVHEKCPVTGKMAIKWEPIKNGGRK